MRLQQVGASPERTQSVLSFVRMMAVRGESFGVAELGFIPNTEDPFGTHKSNSRILIQTAHRRSNDARLTH